MANVLGVPYVTANQMYAAISVLPALGMIFVGIRFNRRLRTKMGMGIDDWFLAASLLFNLGGVITLYIGLQEGAFGYPTPHVAGLTLDEKVTHIDQSSTLTNKLQLAHLLLIALGYGFLKLSIIFFYRRIFVTSSGNKFDWACRACMVMSVLWTIAVFLSLLLQCGTHVSAAWGSLAEGSQYCQAFQHVQTSYAASDLITNCIIWLLPVPVIWRLQMVRSKKLCLSGLFAVSALSIIACIIKLYVTVMFADVGFNPEIDWELTISTMLYWCTVEGGVAIIATCLPDLYYYLDQFLKSDMMSSFRSKLSLSSFGNSPSERSLLPSSMPSPMLAKMGSHAGSALPSPASCMTTDPMLSPRPGAHSRATIARKALPREYLDPKTAGGDTGNVSIVVTRDYSIGSEYV